MRFATSLGATSIHETTLQQGRASVGFSLTCSPCRSSSPGCASCGPCSRGCPHRGGPSRGSRCTRDLPGWQRLRGCGNDGRARGIRVRRITERQIPPADPLHCNSPTAFASPRPAFGSSLTCSPCRSSSPVCASRGPCSRACRYRGGPSSGSPCILGWPGRRLPLGCCQGGGVVRIRPPRLINVSPPRAVEGPVLRAY
jgi:hypothetical protein